MKKFLIGFGIVITLLVILGFVFRGPLMIMAGMAYMAPGHSLSKIRHQAHPITATQAIGLRCRKKREDSADVIPTGVIIRHHQHLGRRCIFRSSRLMSIRNTGINP
ncbi:MAG: hypothetical protein CM15mP68_0080 [Pseudomonadota bacterium]|nr:MAG: hypothetical protein CM15mP68_0080 [Pseudomonadota bacterium]